MGIPHVVCNRNSPEMVPEHTEQAGKEGLPRLPRTNPMIVLSTIPLQIFHIFLLS